MKATWLLEQLVYMQDDFDTHDTIDALNFRFQGNKSILGEVTIKKISGKLSRLVCMRFLARRRTKRLVFTNNGSLLFRGYKYTYRVTAQGHSYIKYRSMKSRLGNGDNRNNNAMLNTSSFDSMMAVLAEEAIQGQKRDKLALYQLTLDLEKERQVSRFLREQLKADSNRHVANIEVAKAFARKEVEKRNHAIMTAVEILLNVLDAEIRPRVASIKPELDALLGLARTVPGWMRQDSLWPSFPPSSWNPMD